MMRNWCNGLNQNDQNTSGIAIASSAGFTDGLQGVGMTNVTVPDKYSNIWHLLAILTLVGNNKCLNHFH